MGAQVPRSTWRLIAAPNPRPAALNLAIEEAVLRAVAARTAPPTLLLYAWAPPALVLGRGQPYSDADVAALRAHGYDLVRRPSGGTAVLHTYELTYGVVVPRDEPRLTGVDIVESYRGLGQALRDALLSLGVDRAEAEPHAESRRGPRSEVCFEIPSDYEITVDGRKLLGSSQMRIRGGILQHGSLPLRGDIAAIGAFLTAHPPAERIRRHAITLEEALGRAVPWSAAADALVNSFAGVLNLSLLPGPLLPQERRAAERLHREKYANDAWTAKVP
jgi:lipoate-protein ligase A